MQAVLLRHTKQCKHLGSIKSFLSPPWNSTSVFKRSLASVQRKQSNNVEKREKREFVKREESTTHATPRTRKYRDVNQRLHHEILSYIKFIEATHEERVQRNHVFETFRSVITQRISSYRPKIQLYGSVATGLELPTTDLDISVSTAQKHMDKKEHLKILRKLRFAFTDAGLISKMMVRAHARVPVMVLTTSKHLGEIGVDITVNSDDGPRCVEVINQYLEEMPALRPLILLFKCFLKERGLNNAATGGLSSYALTCMCINFLQVNPGKRPRDFIDKPIESESLGPLLIDFLVYYGRDFSYKDSFISVSQGKVLPKNTIEWLTHHDALAIECLVRDKNSVARPTRYVPEIQTAFKNAAEALLQLSLSNKTCLGTIITIRHTGATRRSAIKVTINRSADPTKVVSKQVSNKFKGIHRPKTWTHPTRNHSTFFDHMRSPGPEKITRAVA